MKTIIRLSAWAIGLALVAPVTGRLSAQNTTAPLGRVLVLENERVLEGEVSREGDVYIIKRPVGELRVPAGKALTVCASLPDACKFLGSRMNLRDPDERLRLARWCQLHGLREQALSEAKAALQLRPNHAETKHLLTVLERAPVANDPAPPPEPAPAHVDVPPLLEVSGECLTQFTTKVQPILMNTCGSCHATGRGGQFVLLRSTDTGARRATLQNLSAAVKHICFEQPSASPLLGKACIAHGGGQQPPLANQHTPLLTLQTWVTLVAERHPHLRLHGTPLAAMGPVPTPKSPNPVAVKPAVTPPMEVPTARAVTSYPGLAQEPAAAQTPAPRDPPPAQAMPAASADEYDPTVFNRGALPKQ